MGAGTGGNPDHPGVIFMGEPGIGKSRLAAAAADVAADSGSVVLELIGSPLQTDTGLYPVRALLECRCGIVRETGEPERLRRLDAVCHACGLEPRLAVPLLAPVLGIEPRAGYEPAAAAGDELYGLVTQEVTRYLRACLGGAGVVVAEDVHWFDPSTRAVLGALLDSAAGRVLVVMTGRPGGWVPSGSTVEVVELPPLTDAQADVLIEALDPGLSADQRAEVAARCDGVPFYIEQVVNGRSQAGVPETLYEPLLARLHASPEVVPVVEAAAVIGRQFDRDLLRSVVGVPSHELDRVIGELEDAGSSNPGQVVGGSGTNCCARSPPNWHRRACGGACTARSPTSWSDPVNPSGVWSRNTTHTLRAFSTPRRPISRRRPMRGGAAPWPRPVPT